MQRLLAALALLAVAGAHAQEAERELIMRCAQTASAQHAGLQQLADDCPGLAGALDSLGLSAALAEGSAERLARESLPQLLALHRPAQLRAPPRDGLAPVLRSLQTNAMPESRWQRFKNWVAARLGTRGADAIPPWLGQWLERLTPGKLLLRVLVYVLMAAVIVAALVIVARELKLAGVRIPGARRREPAPTDASAGEPSAELDALRRLPPALRPAWLFRLVVARAVAQGRLPPDRSLTHRELHRLAAPDAAADRATWQELTRLAERQVYAPQTPPAQSDADILAAAEKLWLADGKPA